MFSEAAFDDDLRERQTAHGASPVCNLYFCAKLTLPDFVQTLLETFERSGLKAMPEIRSKGREKCILIGQRMNE